MALGLFILVQGRTFADALAIRLDREPDMGVVVALDTSALPPRGFAGSRVNVVLLDADLPDNAALGMSQELSQAPGAPHVIFLSSSNDPERIVRGLRAGAVGWVRKDESLARLIDVIRGVARGGTWVPPDQAEEVSRLLVRGPGHGEDGGAQLLMVLTKTIWMRLLRHAADQDRRFRALRLYAPVPPMLRRRLLHSA